MRLSLMHCAVLAGGLQTEPRGDDCTLSAVGKGDDCSAHKISETGRPQAQSWQAAVICHAAPDSSQQPGTNTGGSSSETNIHTILLLQSYDRL